MKTRNIRKVLGDNVKFYRYKIGYTQKQLAEKSDISPRYISDIENEKANLPIDTLEVLAECLKVETYILLKQHHHNALPKRVKMTLLLLLYIIYFFIELSVL